LNELSPNSVRGLIPGLAYQLGILFAAPTNSIQYALRNWLGYRWALASFEIVTIVLLAIVIMLGTEQHGKDFTTTANDRELNRQHQESCSATRPSS